jgi:predicted amidohydrolase YtcJ
MDPTAMQVEALAVRDGRVVAHGTLDQLSALEGPQTKNFDLDGRTLLPGFVEAHGHPLLSALCWGDPVVDIRAVHTPTYDAALAKIRRRVAKAAPGEFLWFLGLDPQLHDGAREPTKAELDSLSPENPMAVQTSNIHAIYLNSAALRRLNITRDTPVVPGGHVERDEKGEPWRFEERSREYVIESFYAICGERRGLESLKEWLWKFSHAGYTTSSEMGLTPMTSVFYKKTLEAETMPIRVFAYQRAVPEGKETISFEGGDDRFGMKGIKLWGDGSVLLGNVWVSRPYLNTEMTLVRMGLPENNTGRMNYSPEELHRIVMAYSALGHQISVHTHGDRTIDAVLDVYAEALSAHPNAARPFRLEHCGTIRPDQIERANTLGVVCSFFVPYLYYWGEALRDALLGPDAAAAFVPSGTAIRSGMRASLHCDPPMTWPNALLCLHLATTRRTRRDSVIGPSERVDVDSALRAITIDAAYQLRAEDRIGSLEIGKYADLVMLDRNPRDIDPEEILGVKVLGTYVQGELVWESPADSAPTAAERAQGMV